jgi:hypothetical protein
MVKVFISGMLHTPTMHMNAPSDIRQAAMVDLHEGAPHFVMHVVAADEMHVPWTAGFAGVISEKERKASAVFKCAGMKFRTHPIRGFRVKIDAVVAFVVAVLSHAPVVLKQRVYDFDEVASDAHAVVTRAEPHAL